MKEGGDIAHLLLSNTSKLDQLTVVDDCQAVRNIVDYWFEQFIMPTMNLGQARDYFLNIQNQLTIQFDTDFPQAGQAPLFIQTVHHCYLFSVLYSLVHLLCSNDGYKKVILLHLNEPLEARLEICKNLVQHVLGAEPVSITMNDNWYSTLVEQIQQDSVVLYMADMAPSLFEKVHKPGKTSSYLQLQLPNNHSIYVEGISVATILARRLKANQVLLDFPNSETIRVSTLGQQATFMCPITDWVFWPALPYHYTQLDTLPEA